MQIHAVSIGQAVPRENFEAEIQSIFDSAVNLRLAREDQLITVLISDHDELPQGIRIVAQNVTLQSLSVNVRAVARGGVLRFHSSPLIVDLRGAAVWKCPVPHLQTDMSAPSVQQAWITCWKLLNEVQRLRGTAILANDLLQRSSDSRLTQRMSAPVMQLIAATENLDVTSSIQAAQKMIGLGPGLTPAGDDILIGFLAGLWSQSAKNPTLLSFLHSFGNALVQIAKQTNVISRTYIYHATLGQFSSSLSGLVEAVAGAGPVKDAAQMAMCVGHSSGVDSVTGLLIGLSVWMRNSSLSLQARERAHI